jgi:hypothetical protein
MKGSSGALSQGAALEDRVGAEAGADPVGGVLGGAAGPGLRVEEVTLAVGLVGSGIRSEMPTPIRR